MSFTASILDEVRLSVAPDDETLKSAKGRRDDTLQSALRFEGVARNYVSGSIAHGTANSGLDADCGIVLDRRVWKELGPDGADIGPAEVVESVRGHVRTALTSTYPLAKTRLTKRAIEIKFHEELSNGLDPSVDLIVGLQRADGGLWIPNLDRDTWDASDPIRHTELLTADPKSLRVVRARVIRLAKCWNSQFSTPGMCSFNIEALALTSIMEGVGIAAGFAELLAFSAGDVSKRNTPDPANISKPIKLKVEREVMVSRLSTASRHLQDALANDADESIVRTALSDLYWKHLAPPPGAESKSAVASSLREGNSGVRMASTLALGGVGAKSLKTGRAYGRGTN